MPNDQPTPRPPLPPPFSRPTHPGYLQAIHPDSAAGRPLRPTPYASAAIPSVPAEVRQTDPETDRSSPAGFEAAGAGEPDGPHATATDEPADNIPAEPGARATGAEQLDAGQGAAASGGLRSLHDLHLGHGRPTGVPVNPEPAVEAVDAVSDYPTESVWASETAFDWGTSAADRESASASAVHTPPHPGAVAPGRSTVPDTGPSDLARGAAELLEQLARAITRGDVVLPSVSWPQSAPAVLAAVLTALLARSDGDQWEAREASASERLQ